MRLKAKDVESLLERNLPQPTNIEGGLTAQDYLNANAEALDTLIEGLTTFQSQSSPRYGEVLPIPRHLLRSVDRSVDRRADRSAYSSTSVVSSPTTTTADNDKGSGEQDIAPYTRYSLQPDEFLAHPPR